MAKTKTFSVNTQKDPDQRLILIGIRSSGHPTPPTMPCTQRPRRMCGLRTAPSGPRLARVDTDPCALG